MLFSLSLWGSRILLFSLSFKDIYHFSLTHPAIQPMFKKNSWKVCFYFTKKCDMRYPSPNNLQTLGIQSKKEIHPVLMRQKLDFTKLKNPLQSLCCINIVSLIFNVEWNKKKKFCWHKKSLSLNTPQSSFVLPAKYRWHLHDESYMCVLGI